MRSEGDWGVTDERDTPPLTQLFSNTFYITNSII